MTTYIDSEGNEIDSPETQALAGERLLDDVCDAIGRYCILPGDHEYIAVTLWCAYTHLSDVFDFAPRLIIRSAGARKTPVQAALAPTPAPAAGPRKPNTSTSPNTRCGGGDTVATVANRPKRIHQVGACLL